MAYRSSKNRTRKKRSRARGTRKGAAGGKVKVKGHTRSPRGKDAGKKPVYVKGYRRRQGRA